MVDTRPRTYHGLTSGLEPDWELCGLALQPIHQLACLTSETLASKSQAITDTRPKAGRGLAMV